jgi:hypothetical protein
VSTFTEIRDDILVELDRPDMSAVASANLRLAIQHYGREHWWFNEDISTAALALNTEYVTLTSNYVMHVSCAIRYGGNYRPLTFIDHHRHEAQYTTTSGTPQNYSIFTNRLRVQPIADTSYEFQLFYVKTLPALSAGGSNTWTVEGEDLIKYRAERIITATVLQDFQWAAAFKELEAEALERMRLETQLKTGLGLTKRWPALKT